MKLSIIIVNYKTPGLLLDCLRSLKNPISPELEIIVVDNDSGDGSDKLLQMHFPQVRYEQMGYNAGFARANNHGIRIAMGETVLLLNSDTLEIDNAILNCYHALASSGYIAAGVQLLNADGSPQISGNYVMTGGLNHLLPLPYLGQFLGWIAKSANAQKTNVPDTNITTEVDWINGAFLMVKRSAFEKAGLLDEDFFLYYEESEWCYRLSKVGKLAIFGQYKLTHLQGESAGNAFDSAGKGYADLSDRKGLQLMVSCLLRIRKQWGIGWLLIHFAAYLCTIIIYFFGMLIEGIMTPRTFRDRVKHWAGFTSNVFQTATCLPRIVKGRPYFYKML